VSLGTWPFTGRAYPVVEMGWGDTRVPVGSGGWDNALWDTPGNTWAGTEPTWMDITCDTLSFQCEYGRQRTTDRFIAGTATVLVRNTTGWADPLPVDDPYTSNVRPGRAIRMGVIHVDHGPRWLFYGFVDAVTPTYDATEPDLVELACIDALGEMNRAEFVPLDPAPPETITTRIDRVLDLARWPGGRDLQPTADTVIGGELSGQAADLIGQAADSDGGVVFGDTTGTICYRSRDWQTFLPGTPLDGIIGDAPPNRVIFGEYNYLWFGAQVVEGEPVNAGEVCPIRWERPFNRADIATRVIVGRDGDDATLIQLDDPEAQRLYGIEPFKRTDLLTESSDVLALLARRALATRGAGTAPRVRSVSLDARTSGDALDLMATVDVYKPSRYRCRLVYPRGIVFDGEYFATGVSHEITATSWALELNLDSAEPFTHPPERWDTGHWDATTWVAPVAELRATVHDLRGALV
jgi:hypothetical protein